MKICLHIKIIENKDLAALVLLTLDAWLGLRARAAELCHELLVDARQSQACRILMSIRASA